jgi:hypothetical protein
VDIDHRRGRAFAPGELEPFLEATWSLIPDVKIQNEAVHRLTDLGAVVTVAAHGTSPEGFVADWSEIALLTFDGDLVKHCELFDDTDLDAALARFDELQPSTRRLENAACRAWQRFQASLAAEDWAAMTDMSAPDAVTDDRRRVIGGGVHRGRETIVAIMRTISEIGLENIKVTVVATRGERLVLDRVNFSGRDQAPEPFHSEILRVLEIDADERLARAVYFDPDDVDAAFEELDACYLAGEAAAHARTWTTTRQVEAAYNRHEVPPTTQDFVNVDRRRGRAIADGDMIAYLHATWNLTPGIKGRIEAVHRLTNFGTVITDVLTGTSKEGFDAEWREIGLLAFEGDRICRFELFDEADLDAALARFDELQTHIAKLDNAAIRSSDRLFGHFAASEWDAVAQILAADFHQDDRRRVVGAGVRHGRDEEIADLRAISDLWAGNATPTYIATRGERLALMRLRFSVRDHGDEGFVTDVLGICEINADERIVAAVSFDLDDLDGAFEELDARYLAGEAAAHPRTWLAQIQVRIAYNQHKVFPTTEDFVSVDHRRGTAFPPDTMVPYVADAWNVVPNLKGYIETVHRLTDSSVLSTVVRTGTSQDGFDAEWREIGLVTFKGDQICRFEVFDEADLDAALARFDEIEPPARRVENAASQAVERYWIHFAAQNWDALAGTMAEDVCTHDRRRVVNAGVVTGRVIHITNMRAVADVGFEGLTSTVVATRGRSLVLVRIRSSVRNSPPGEVTAEMLSVIGVDADNKIVVAVMFDPDDIGAAFEELEARYLEGEAAPYARTWSAMARSCAVFNEGKLPATTPDSVFVDHRPVLAVDAIDLPSYFRAMWDVTPDIRVQIEAVHRLSELGAVVTHVVNSTSSEGFDAEWSGVLIYTFEADMINRSEVFDKGDLDAALARFDELDQPAS